LLRLPHEVFGREQRSDIEVKWERPTFQPDVRSSLELPAATVGRGFGTSRPEPGDLVFFFRTYADPGQDWTHVGVVSRIDSNGTVWMIDAPGARAAGDPPDAPFGRVREEPIAGSWLQHRPTYARIPDR
jgi:hypothetical protein